MRPSVYLETTIPSYLTARPSRDLLVAANQQATREWWATRERYDLFVSPVVFEECEAGDPEAVADRLAALAGVPVLGQTPRAVSLAADLVRGLRLPRRASADAEHIAVAAAHGVQYLLTWNCTHLANAALWPRIERVCRAAGCEPPRIITPPQLMPREDES